MAENVASAETGGKPWRIIGWSIPLVFLSLPFILGAPWTASDYIFMAVLFGVIGLGIEFLVRQSTSLPYRLAAAVTLLAAFLTVWVNAAVGMIGDSDNPLNLGFLVVLFVALIGSVLVRFRAGGMARVMAGAAAAQLVASALGLNTDPRGAVLSMGFATFWLIAAGLYWAAANEGPETPDTKRKSSGRSAYCIGVGIAVVAALMTIWVNLAVGMIGNEENPLNLMYGGVILVALVGALIARFKPEGMAGAMIAAAIAQVVVAVVAQLYGHFTWGLTIFFGGAWLLSAVLFRNAARDEDSSAERGEGSA
ncbi:MAG TPA: hypothetical protein VNA29_08810 [Sphingomicrobium sp.]|nr:hypothetical protein [Sphingomicrobium sp.]